MAQWLVRRVSYDEGETYEVTRDGERMLGIDLREDASVTDYRNAALMLRANVVRRLEDPEPVFAVHASDDEAVAFVEMLNT